MEETGFGAKESDKFCNFRNMLEMNNIQKEFLEREKIGRNDPCPCGSGKKFKKCCGA